MATIHNMSSSRYILFYKHILFFTIPGSLWPAWILATAWYSAYCRSECPCCIQVVGCGSNQKILNV